MWRGPLPTSLFPSSRFRSALNALFLLPPAPLRSIPARPSSSLLLHPRRGGGDCGELRSRARPRWWRGAPPASSPLAATATSPPGSSFFSFFLMQSFCKENSQIKKNSKVFFCFWMQFFYLEFLFCFGCKNILYNFFCSEAKFPSSNFLNLFLKNFSFKYFLIKIFSHQNFS